MASAGRDEGGPHSLLVRVWTDAATEENRTEVPQKTRNGSSIWSSSSTSGYV